MGEWKRSSHKLTIDETQPELLETIKKHIEAHNLILDLDDYLICIETISDSKKKKLFGRGIPKQTIQVAIVTPKWLIVGTQSEKPDSIGAISFELKDSIAKDYRDEPGYNIIPDSGVTITGPNKGIIGTNTNPNVSIFITLGEEPVADEFKEILFGAIQKKHE